MTDRLIDKDRQQFNLYNETGAIHVIEANGSFDVFKAYIRDNLTALNRLRISCMGQITSGE